MSTSAPESSACARDCVEVRQFELIQQIGRVGYWEYDAAQRGFIMPTTTRVLLASIAEQPDAGIEGLFDVLSENEARRLEDALAAAIEQALPLHLELRLKRGARIVVRGAPLDADRRRYGGTFQDITREKQAEASREEVIHQLQALLDSLRVGVTVFDHELRLMFWNELIYDILGLPRAAVYRYVRFEELIRYPAERGEYGPGDPLELVRQRAELARRFEPHRFERRARDGRMLLVEGYPFSSAGQIAGFVTTYTDITAQKLTEQTLLRQNNVLSTIIDNFPGAISLFDADLRLAAHNEQFKTLLELPAHLFDHGAPHFEEFIRFNAARGEYGEGDTEQQVRMIVERARNFQPHKLERVRPNGLALEVRGMPLPGGGFVTIYIDITERKRAEERIRVMALQDALTGLPNRLSLNDQIEQALERARDGSHPFALLFLDLDGFKAVNDTLGHDAGDVLLVAVAAKLKTCVRETDVVARLGGDEFVILLHDTGEAMVAEQIAAVIVATLTAPFSLGEASARIGTSIGIALFPDHGTSRESLLRAADEAMYQAKKSGRGTWRLAVSAPDGNSKSPPNTAQT